MLVGTILPLKYTNMHILEQYTILVVGGYLHTSTLNILVILYILVHDTNWQCKLRLIKVALNHLLVTFPLVTTPPTPELTAIFTELLRPL